MAYAEAWARRYPENPKGRLGVAAAHRDLGKALMALHRPSEAIDHLRNAEAIDGAPATTPGDAPLSAFGLADDLWQCGQGLRDMGDIAGAAAATRRSIVLFNGLASPDSSALYAFACARAALAGLAGRASSGVSTDEGLAEADKSIGLLVRAVADGERYPSRLQTEPAFDPLRNRPDFRLLMLDLAFPAQPFARRLRLSASAPQPADQVIRLRLLDRRTLTLKTTHTISSGANRYLS